MSEIMTPIGFDKLLKWMMEEHNQKNSVFGLPSNKFYRNASKNSTGLLDQKISSPAGAAAGPNTQLAQNILTAYLGGFKFIELKTVQTMDGEELRKCIARPCIDAVYEGYNCEWSTELTTEEALCEYIKAWFLVSVARIEFGISEYPDFLFNMSVGYDYEGITSDKIDNFIETLKDAKDNEVFTSCYDHLFSNMNMFKSFTHNDLLEIKSQICTSITLSTLHGCPPEEIEKIAGYFIQQKDINTYIKLNPTLLGYEKTRDLLDKMGYTNVDFDNTHFEQDLKYNDAVPMIKRLKKLADNKGLVFGVKITNTFPVKSRDILPSEFMYMSGKSLYLLSINVASMIATEFKGSVPISYSGGADFYNIKDIYGVGIKPITVATTILKPGGYARGEQISTACEGVNDRNKIDFKKLKELANDVVSKKHYARVKEQKSDIENTLPLFDCGVPGCKENGCPINQQIPNYLSYAAYGDKEGAFKIIVNDNVLPSITGEICPHPCQSNCARNYYDESVKIRSVKKMAANYAQQSYIYEYDMPTIVSDKKVCVIGAGPAGVSVASYLARNGIDVTVFEKEKSAMGVVKHIIPEFRISDELINIDFELSVAYGAKYKFGLDADIDIEKLKQEYDYIVLAFGAYMPGYNPLKDGKENIIDALDFLKEDKLNKKNYGHKVGVIGGGDVAMDAARVAKRSGSESYIIYRRTEEFMPASTEEIELAFDDGVDLIELVSPISYDGKTLVCENMKLGEFGDDGRRKVIGTGEKTYIKIDTLVCATGSNVDKSIFSKNGLDVDVNGMAVLDETYESSIENVYVSGDCSYGAKTIVEAMGNSKKIAIDIMQKLGIEPDFRDFDDKFNIDELYNRKGRLYDSEIDSKHKCLGCNEVCELCCEVCPNRANIPIVDEDGNVQILHMDGMCNECGNCAGFCPHGGLPYRQKFTVFWSLDDFLSSYNYGFYINSNGEFLIRHKDVKFKHKEYVLGDKAVPEKVWKVIRAYLKENKYTWIS